MDSPFVFETELGWIGICASDRGLKRLNLPVSSFAEACRNIGYSGNNQSPPESLSGIVDRIRLYLGGRRMEFTGGVDLSCGSQFQQQVWETNRRIPYGETRSYSWIAEQIGKPKAVRAVGSALGKNPLPIIIPCHRVLAKDGGIGGYGGGIELKRFLLNLEATSR